LNKVVKDVLRILVFLVVGLGILAWIFKQQNAKYQADCLLKGVSLEECSLWLKLKADFLSVDVFWIFMVLVAFMISNMSRAHRLMMLLDGIGLKARFGNTFWTTMLGYFANLGIPRIGEVVRGAVLARYEKIPVEKVLGTIVIDRGVDVLSLLFAIFLAAVLQYDVLVGYIEEHMGSSVFEQNLIWFLLAFMVLSVAALWLLRKQIMRTALFVRMRNVIIGFIDGLKSIRSIRNMPLFLFHTAVIWIMYYMMTYMCFKAFEPTAGLGLLAALMVFVFGGLGIVFPSPGGMGTYHAMVMAGLALYGIAGDDAFSFANILYFSVQLFCNILFGVLALIILPITNRRLAV